MPRFPLVATVQRVVTDTITLIVEADNEFEAFVKAEDVLESFPENHIIDGVPYCYIEDREYNDNTVLKIEIQEEYGAG